MASNGREIAEEDVLVNVIAAPVPVTGINLVKMWLLKPRGKSKQYIQVLHTWLNIGYKDDDSIKTGLSLIKK